MPRCRCSTAASWGCSSPASTGWRPGCASARRSASCSAARWARTWPRRPWSGARRWAARRARWPCCSPTSWVPPAWPRTARRTRWWTCSTGSSPSSWRWSRSTAAGSTSSRATRRWRCSARRSRWTTPRTARWPPRARSAERLAEEVPDLTAGIGVSGGTALAGNVGAEQRFEYTVIGDPVNEAARLTELAKEEDGHVLASLRAGGAGRRGGGRAAGRPATRPSCAGAHGPRSWRGRL